MLILNLVELPEKLEVLSKKNIDVMFISKLTESFIHFIYGIVYISFA